MIGKFLDLIWPRDCEVCGRPADRPGRHLCSDCLMRLPLIPTDGLCRKCGRDAIGLNGEYLCEDCEKYRPSFDRAVSVMRFEGEARDLVNSFKFNDRLHTRDDLVDLLEAAARTRFKLEEISLVIPMPSTLYHRWWRGYNQCAILGRALAKRLEKPYRTVFSRIGSPKTQGGLNEEERRKNVIGTFKSRSVSGTVLLVDDIMTTGSTLSEAARTLKAAGAEKVWAITLTRSIRL